MPLKIYMDTGTQSVPVCPGQLLTEVTAASGIALNTRCAGTGSCGGCAVRLGPGIYRVRGRETRIAPGKSATALACQVEVHSTDAEVHFPRTSMVEHEAVIDDDFSWSHWMKRRRPDIASTDDSTPGALGLAVDIGTTTVAALLVDLKRGKVLAKASMYNQQIRRADDVASRIFCCQTEKDVTALQQLVVQETVDPLLSECCAKARRTPDSVHRVAVSGNTVMTHLFYGLSPVSIGVSPFTPLTRQYKTVRAKSLGLFTASDATVYAVPSIAGYVGGDIVSDIYLTGMDQPCGPTLMIDVGTNGEVVFREGDRMVACATAAGPAFEGHGLTHGCRAATGAIERIGMDGAQDWTVRVIGNTRPTGLCGSAVIDFIANGWRTGLINDMGRYDISRLRALDRYLDDPAWCGDSKACVIVPANDTGRDQPIFVTEQDIAQVLKAKAAIYAAVTTLLETLGKTPQDLERIYLAGGFARHISLSNAIAIGLFPDVPRERYEIIGNGSLAGACFAVCDPTVYAAYDRIIDLPEVVELNRIATFEANFIDALALPHLDTTLFPTVTQNPNIEE